MRYFDSLGAVRDGCHFLTSCRRHEFEFSLNNFGHQTLNWTLYETITEVPGEPCCLFRLVYFAFNQFLFDEFDFLEVLLPQWFIYRLILPKMLVSEIFEVKIRKAYFCGLVQGN